MSRLPLPPLTAETTTRNVQLAEDAWNSRDPDRVALAYAPDSVWHNRNEFLTGHEQIAVRFQYEWRDADSQRWRSHGNEPWEFADGFVAGREASNDVETDEFDRTLFGRRT
ncbi:DUF1348 family protein [Kribbella sp. NPDC050124]|uniref:DUF1348 family protein n=1 Tax=Kribbella sp. NPDC050124 TaxID=3364114 RepID=UPI0037B542CD